MFFQFPFIGDNEMINIKYKFSFYEIEFEEIVIAILSFKLPLESGRLD